MDLDTKYSVDVWDIILVGIVLVLGYLIYISPVVTISDYPLWVQFLFTISDQTFGFLVVSLIFKKIVEKSKF